MIGWQHTKYVALVNNIEGSREGGGRVTVECKCPR